MENNFNFGINKHHILTKVGDEFVKNGSLNENKESVSNFVKLIKESEILKLQYDIFDKLENKSIKSEVAASKYIDECLNKFNKFNKEDIIKENKILGESTNVNLELISEEKINLYNAIQNLIYESVNNDTDIDLIHESFEYVLDHITKSRKKQIIKSIDESEEISENKEMLTNNDSINNDLNLNEEEEKIVKSLISENIEEQKTLFENLKKETITLLESIDKTGIEDKIHATIEKLNNTKFNEKMANESIMNLYNLKSKLND